MSLTPPAKVGKLQGVLRTKAKESPSYRFYALYDKMYREDVLAYAYQRCKANGGAAGVDGQRFSDIQAYGEEKWLDELAFELKNQTYCPGAVRRVWIPKADGKQRPLGIPTIRDRVVQMAWLVIVEPIFDEDIPPEQHAYRPNHNAHQAIREVQAWIDRGYTELPDQPFQFLGYQFSEQVSWTSGKRYVTPSPAKVKVQGICEQISELTSSRRTWLPIEDEVRQLNQVLSGWANYFSLGYVTGAWQIVQQHTCRRLRWWLRRKISKRGGRQSYPDMQLYEEYGLLNLTKSVRRNSLWAKGT